MRKAKTLTKLIYSTGFSVIIVLLVFGVSETFKVRTVKTTASVSDMQGFPSLSGEYIFSVSEDKIKRFFLKNPKVSQVRLQKNYPNTLIIEVVYRNKVAQITTLDGIYIVDGQGTIFEKVAASSSLPTLHLPSRKIDLGTNIIQKNINLALKIIELANKNNLHFIDIIPFEEDSVSMTTTGGTQIIVGEEAKAEEIVSSLQMILKRFTIEGKTPVKIDFRFEQPVVNF